MTATLPPAERCRSCGAPVIWAVTVLAKAMPVDAEPSTAGNLALDPPGEGRTVPLVRVVSEHLRFGRTDLHTSHFVTCPQAGKWRRRKGTTS